MKRKLLLFCFPLFGVLLTAYSPMASYSMAQSATDAQLQTLKQKATDELNRRISNYQKTLDDLKVDVQLSANGGSGSTEVANGSASGTVTCASTSTTSPSPSPVAGQLGIHTVIGLPCGLKDKVKSFLQKVVDELKSLKTKVSNVSSLTGMQGLAQNIDTQFGLDQITQVQAQTTQAVSSMSGVLDNLKTAYSNVQSRVTALKDCLSGNTDSTASPSPQSGDQTGQCVSLDKDNAEGAAAQAQSTLDGLSTIISTISSIIMSAIALLATLVTSFSGLTGGLGSLDSLGNIGNLSSLLGSGSGGLGSLTSLAGSAGGITGLLSSFTGILSQLNIGQSMSGGALGNLSSLTGLLGGLSLPF